MLGSLKSIFLEKNKIAGTISIFTSNLGAAAILSVTKTESDRGARKRGLFAGCCWASRCCPSRAANLAKQPEIRTTFICVLNGMDEF
jgi:hypothetical protein